MKLTKLKCNQCGHEWLPRIEDHRQCPNPKCRSLRWDKPNRIRKEA